MEVSVPPIWRAPEGGLFLNVHRRQGAAKESPRWEEDGSGLPRKMRMFLKVEEELGRGAALRVSHRGFTTGTMAKGKIQRHTSSENDKKDDGISSSSSLPSYPLSVSSRTPKSSMTSASSSSTNLPRGRCTSEKEEGRFSTPGKQRRAPQRGHSKSSSSSSSSKASSSFRIRPREPWGLQQLRDSWSEDAMSTLPAENLSERTHRAYRYHPEEYQRFHIKYAAYLTIPCIILGVSGGYYFHTGRPIWKGDPQEILNYIRRLDTSPRSSLYAFADIYDHNVIPEHIRHYREVKEGEKERREAIFRVIHTVCRKPTTNEWKEILSLAEEDGTRDKYFHDL